MKREHREYKEGDWIELDPAEQQVFKICLDKQSEAVALYRLFKVANFSPDIIELAKKRAQFHVVLTWRFLQSCFPGLDDTMSFGQDADDVGKIDKFMIISKQSAFEHFSKDPKAMEGRVLTDEWEREFEEYKAAKK